MGKDPTDLVFFWRLIETGLFFISAGREFHKLCDGTQKLLNKVDERKMEETILAPEALVFRDEGVNTEKLSQLLMQTRFIVLLNLVLYSIYFIY